MDFTKIMDFIKNFDFTKQLKGYRSINIFLFLLGAVLIAWGVKDKDTTISGFGCSIFGASIGLFFGRMANKEVLNEIVETYKNYFRLKFTSQEADLKAFRRRWYIYHVTEVEENKWGWCQQEIDCTVQSYGELKCIAKPRNTRSKEIWEYEVELGLRGDELIMIHSLITPGQGTESPSICLFPSVSNGAHKVFFPGIMILNSYYGHEAITPVILSKECQITNKELIGAVIDEADKEKLDNLWKTNNKSNVCLLSK